MAVSISEVYSKEPAAGDKPILMLGIGAGQYRDDKNQTVKGWVFIMQNLQTGIVMEGYLNGAELKSLKAGENFGTVSGFSFDLSAGQIFRLNVGRNGAYPCVVKKVVADAPPLILSGKVESATPPPLPNQQPDYSGTMLRLWLNQKGLDVLKDL